jgi:predicted dehydrogenase
VKEQESRRVAFVTQADVAAAGEVPEIGIGMLGYAFMGKAHSNAYLQLPHMFWPPPARPRLIAICGRNEAAVREAARRYGYERACTDWHALVEDERIEIFDNGAPNNVHAEPCIQAAQAGKHVLCEKPLARDAEEAAAMLAAVRRAGVKHACAFNCRLVPAVRLARDILDSGRLGKIRHFRAQYLQEWMADPHLPRVWRKVKEVTGSGAVGDFSHIVDLARYLCGEPKCVQSIVTTFVTERPLEGSPGQLGKVEVDDAFVTAVEFHNGAIGSLEGSQYCPGRKNYLAFEINGERGSIAYDHEELNYLRVYFADEEPPPTRGYRRISVTEVYHPYMEHWWPQGHINSWAHTFVNQAYHMVDAAVNGTELSPYVATFEDGYRAAVICDAILESARAGRRVDIDYR